MLNPGFLYELLAKKGVEFITGVPDSLLKYFCSYAFDKGHDLIAANEGSALSIAAGYHLASGEIPLVYLQNSGFGNMVNPLTSLANSDVYSIPILIMVGWRGKPGIKDEPQHIAQGATQEAQLDALGISYTILSDKETEVEVQIERAFENLKTHSAPYVLLVPPKTFEDYKLKSKAEAIQNQLKREDVLDSLVQNFEEDDIIVSTTGKTSRELFELRKRYGMGHHRDFLVVGSMGHASQIALGIALEKPNRRVFCIDGDGAMIMHMGGLTTIGEQAPENLYHVLINNGAHESVGGQPTAGLSVDFGKIAQGCGYKSTFRAANKTDISDQLNHFLKADGPALLEIFTEIGARSDLGRPTISPVDNKESFMDFLKGGD